jgi:uncharacterized damage-inducible protein DinB
MTDFHEIIKDAMYGADTHINTLKGLTNLTHAQAIAHPIKNSHSTYEIVFHMIIWQEVLIKNIKGLQVDWKAATEHDWPAKEESEATSWEELQEKFRQGFHEMESLLTSIDLRVRLQTLLNAPAMKAFLVLNQHNSYHLGQISKNRVAQGTWPPSIPK